VDGPWARVTPREVHELLSGLPIRWWVAGGWALDVDGALPHSDIDVAVLRPEHELLREYLSDWDLRIAHKGALRAWTGGTVGPPENAVWARPTAADAWQIDFKIEPVEGDQWLYRRDPAIRVPVAELGGTVDGIPFLSPAVAQLYRDQVGRV
jgi:Aminoglycoside-2''-adenylyltransferase